MSGNRPDEAHSARPQSEADAAAARIAELVRRSNERRQQAAARGSTDGDATPEGLAEASPWAASASGRPPGPGPASTPVGRSEGSDSAPAGSRLPGHTPTPGDAAPASGVTERTAELPAVPGRTAYPESGEPPLPAGGLRRGSAAPAGRRKPLADLLRDRRVVAAVILVAAVVVAFVVWLVASGQGESPAAPPRASSAASVPGGFTVKATDSVTDCRAHSRGKVQQVFAETPCRRTERYLATGVVDGRPVLYVVSRITMPSASDAAAIKVVVDGTGTGNINDLLREGVTYPGAPQRMPRSGYGSLQDGAVLVVAEAGFTDGGSTSNTDSRLRAAAAAVAKHVVDLGH